MFLYIYVRNLLNIFLGHDLFFFGIKEKSIILTHLAIARNIPQRLKTDFLVQGYML